MCPAFVLARSKLFLQRSTHGSKAKIQRTSKGRSPTREVQGSQVSSAGLATLLGRCLLLRFCSRAYLLCCPLAIASCHFLRSSDFSTKSVVGTMRHFWMESTFWGTSVCLTRPPDRYLFDHTFCESCGLHARRRRRRRKTKAGTLLESTPQTTSGLGSNTLKNIAG